MKILNIQSECLKTSTRIFSSFSNHNSRLFKNIIEIILIIHKDNHHRCFAQAGSDPYHCTWQEILFLSLGNAELKSGRRRQIISSTYGGLWTKIAGIKIRFGLKSFFGEKKNERWFLPRGSYQCRVSEWQQIELVTTAVWPDAGMKRRQIVSKSCQKSSQSKFLHKKRLVWK